MTDVFDFSSVVSKYSINSHCEFTLARGEEETSGKERSNGTRREQTVNIWRGDSSITKVVYSIFTVYSHAEVTSSKTTHFEQRPLLLLLTLLRIILLLITSHTMPVCREADALSSTSQYPQKQSIQINLIT